MFLLQSETGQQPQRLSFFSLSLSPPSLSLSASVSRVSFHSYKHTHDKTDMTTRWLSYKVTCSSRQETHSTRQTGQKPSMSHAVAAGPLPAFHRSEIFLAVTSDLALTVLLTKHRPLQPTTTTTATERPNEPLQPSGAPNVYSWPPVAKAREWTKWLSQQTLVRGKQKNDIWQLTSLAPEARLSTIFPGPIHHTSDGAASSLVGCTERTNQRWRVKSGAGHGGERCRQPVSGPWALYQCWRSVNTAGLTLSQSFVGLEWIN